MLENYRFKFRRGDKFIFVPTALCVKKAERLLAFGKGVPLPDYFYHYRPGGHVTALHRHIENDFFFRIDLKQFFYSIGRNRISRVLRQNAFDGNARTFSEWSTVRNPYPEGPRYVLPIGFPQSPLLASLTLYGSAVASAIEDALGRGDFVSVYFDDLIGSSQNIRELAVTYRGILDACVQANFVTNVEKLIEPAEAIRAFNCDLRRGFVTVSEERIEKFYGQQPTAHSAASFEVYCARIRRRNVA